MAFYDIRPGNGAGLFSKEKISTTGDKKGKSEEKGKLVSIRYKQANNTSIHSRYQNVNPIWILLKKETESGSGISWAICKSASCSRQVTTPAPQQSVFTGQIPFLPPNQQRQSTEGKHAYGQAGKNKSAANSLDTRSSAIAEGPRDASCQLKSC